MNKNYSGFLFLLLFTSFVAFGLHLFVLNLYSKPLFDALIIEAYAVNILTATITYSILFYFREKRKNQLGFLFLGGRVLKFLVFFLVFNSSYKFDGQITPQEFFAFFTPYVLALIIEVFCLSKWMNKIE